MANSDKNILITPNRGLSGLPEISFTGAGNSSVNLRISDSTTGTLEFSSGINTVFSVDSSQNGDISIASRGNSNLSSLLVSTEDDVEINADFVCRKEVILPGVGTTVSILTNRAGEAGQIAYNNVSKTPMLSNRNTWMYIGRPELIKDPNTLLLHFDPEDRSCYYRDNILQNWTDYNSNQANYEIISRNSVKIKDTYNSWVGYYYASIPFNSRWYLSFTAWSDSDGSALVLDNDGANNNFYNASYTLYRRKQTFTSFYDTSATGNILHFFRRNSGGNLYVSNVSYYTNNRMHNLATGAAAGNLLFATLNNGVSYEEDDGALWFNGDSCNFNTFQLGNGNIAWTASAWIKTYTLVDGLGQGPIFSNSSGGPVSSVLGVNQGKPVYWTYYSGAWQKKLGNTYIADGKWHQITWVQYTNFTMDIYVDGIHDSYHGNTTAGNNNPIDRMGSSWTSTYDGAIGQVMIYKNRSLTADEVLRNYTALRWRYRG
jgi:hypothetical protein